MWKLTEFNHFSCLGFAVTLMSPSYFQWLQGAHLWFCYRLGKWEFTDLIIDLPRTWVKTPFAQIVWMWTWIRFSAPDGGEMKDTCTDDNPSAPFGWNGAAFHKYLALPLHRIASLECLTRKADQTSSAISTLVLRGTPLLRGPLEPICLLICRWIQENCVLQAQPLLVGENDSPGYANWCGNLRGKEVWSWEDVTVC